MDESKKQSEPSCSSSKGDKKKAQNDESQEIPYESTDVPAQAKLVETYYEYLVLISIILIIFAAFRNSVTW
jgi:hypothetical protein